MTRTSAPSLGLAALGFMYEKRGSQLVLVNSGMTLVLGEFSDPQRGTLNGFQKELTMDKEGDDDGRPDDYDEILAQNHDEMGDEEREAYNEGRSDGLWKSIAQMIAEEEEGVDQGLGIEGVLVRFSAYRSWPSLDLLAPRHTDYYDGLFHALLARAASAKSFVEEYRNKADHTSSYLLRSGDQAFFPLSGEPYDGDVPSGRVVILRRSTAIRNFFHSWTATRRAANHIALSATRAIGGSRTVNRYDGMIEIAVDGSEDGTQLCDEELASFLESLGIPYDEGKSHWNTRRTALIAHISHPDSTELTADQLRCPFCGPVRPLLVSLSSPSWTWENLMGRGSNHLCCPRCLGNFGIVANRIN